MFYIIMASAFSVFTDWSKDRRGIIIGLKLSLRIIATIILTAFILFYVQPYLGIEIPEDYAWIASVILIFFPKYVKITFQTALKFAGHGVENILTFFKK